MNKIEQIERAIQDVLSDNVELTNDRLDPIIKALQLSLEIAKGDRAVYTPTQLQVMMCEGVVDILQKQLDEFAKAVDSLKTPPVIPTPNKEGE